MSAIVCGWQRSDTKKHLPSAPLSRTRAHSVIASAAAVASSRSDAFATSSPVNEITIVWKFKSASRRPCAISAWYGVYCVYQPGFSRMFRLKTAGMTVPW